MLPPQRPLFLHGALRVTGPRLLHLAEDAAKAKHWSPGQLRRWRWEWQRGRKRALLPGLISTGHTELGTRANRGTEAQRHRGTEAQRRKAQRH
eukprot:2098046-Alexandrium_andersonii.AAC.1